MIADAVLLIQAANTAIGAVKELIGNGKDLTDCGKQLGKYFDSKAELQKKANPNGRGSGLEAFMALEKLKAQEYELKQLMIYSGRANMWQDWLRFQVEQKRAREDAKADIQRKKMARGKAIKTGFMYVGAFLAVLTAVLAGVAMVYWLVAIKDRK
mgnify:CR=1 FL=1